MPGEAGPLIFLPSENTLTLLFGMICSPLNFVYRRRMHGDSLLEVMLAVWLMAMAGLGSVSLQLRLARAQQSVLWYEQAVQLTDAAAEALRSAYPIHRVKAEWGARAAALLPAGGLRIVGQDADVQLLTLTLHWNEPAQWPQIHQRFILTHGRGRHVNPRPEDCPQLGASGITRCVSIAIVKLK